MGYTTDFEGKLKFNKQLSLDDHTFLKKLAETRRMARNVDAKYGAEGEFYVEDDEMGVIDYNREPKTQPGLWLQWVPTDDGWWLEWDGGEKFYQYVEWLEYLIKRVLSPRGYLLNGSIDWSGEEDGDIGRIVVKDNIVTTQQGVISYQDKPTPEKLTNGLVYLTIQEALVVKLGMVDEGGGDSSTGGIENVYSRGDYKVTIEMRN